MRFSPTALVAPVLLATSATARFVIYADEWHPTRPTNPEDRAGVDHVVLAFAMANATAAFQPKVPISTIKSEFPNAKVMIAVGGWGDDIGFFHASKSDASIKQFADDVATMLTNTGADGVDIDWEYPGGNGADYKQVPNSEKTYQIEAFPKLLAATRAAIGSKILSIAVPGKEGDMMAFTAENGPKIWNSVDYVNVMSYDLMNRRDNVTKHHTSVAGSLQTIKNYLAIGAPRAKINLGFAYYAKYFTTAGDCSANPLGCPIVLAEDPITGKDLLTSGAYTFETSHMVPVDPSSITDSYDGTCGPEKKTRCASGCCSQYGNCGTSPEHCSGACQHAFGTGCTDPDVAGSWQKAIKNGKTDEKAGGQYYFDAENKLVWTWDTPELISRKFREIVEKEELGGVMAWSLGEDSFDWSHIRQMAAESKKSTSGADGGSGSAPKPEAHLESGPVDGEAPEIEYPTVHSNPAPKPASHSHSDPNIPYNVVWVDGSEDGPGGQDPEFPTTYHGDAPGPEKQEVPVIQQQQQHHEQHPEQASPPHQQSAAYPPFLPTEHEPNNLPFSPEYEAALRSIGAVDDNGATVSRGRACRLKKRVRAV